MSKNSSLLLFGGLVVIVSFLGIPSSWKTIIFSLLGVLIITVTLLLRRDITTGALCMHLNKDKHTDSYKQNGMLHDSSYVNGNNNQEDTYENTEATAEEKTENSNSNNS